MSKKPRRRRSAKKPRKNSKRAQHHGHFKHRVRARYELKLTDEHLEEIIGLIRKKRSESVQFVGRGKTFIGQGGEEIETFIYLVVFSGKVLPVVYSPQQNWLSTCFENTGALLAELPKDRADSLREWIRERTA